MAQPVPARLTTSELRKFGLAVGFAFFVLGIVVRWRGMWTPAQVFWYLGGALFILGLVLPAVLRPAYRAWMGLALMISKVTTPILLGIIYFGIITPTGLIRRMLGHDAVRSKATRSTFWVPREAGREQPEMTHQF